MYHWPGEIWADSEAERIGINSLLLNQTHRVNNTALTTQSDSSAHSGLIINVCTKTFQSSLYHSAPQRKAALSESGCCIDFNTARSEDAAVRAVENVSVSESRKQDFHNMKQNVGKERKKEDQSECYSAFVSTLIWSLGLMPFNQGRRSVSDWQVYFAVLNILILFGILKKKIIHAAQFFSAGKMKNCERSPEITSIKSNGYFIWHKRLYF